MFQLLIIAKKLLMEELAMEKILFLIVMSIVITMPLAGASNLTNQNFIETAPSKNIVSNSDFTHTVFAELGATAVCPYCPGASSTMYNVYTFGDYEFSYVTLVYNVGSEITKYKVTKRAYDELGITSVPHAFFDGKYSNFKGKPEDEQQYRTKIESCGARDVLDLDIDLNVAWQGNSVLDISGTVTNNGDKDYEGHLRVYIVEPNSRWNDAIGEPIHFGVLDIPVDKNLAIKQSYENRFRPTAESYDFSQTWRGSVAGYNDISIDNIMVIATVFEKETDRAIQSVSAQPTEMLTNMGGYTNVTAEEAWEMLNDPSTIQYPIDVRTVAEWDLERIDTPSPESPILYADLQHGVALEEFMQEYADKEVLIYCRSGNRSYIATELLLDNGFTGTIYQMVGGIKDWQRRGYPTIPKFTVTINVQIKGSSSDEGTVTIEDKDYPVYDFDIVSCGTIGCYTSELSAGEYDIRVSGVENHLPQKKTVLIEEDTEITFNFPKIKALSLKLFFLDFIQRIMVKQTFPIINYLT